MKPAVSKILRLLAAVAGVLLLLGGVAGGWFYSRVRASLPQLDGTSAVAGLAAPVKVERDAQGVPTVRGQSRADVSRALGWLHAQERFFQMDLLRRSSAGELAELFGAAALPRDRAARMHGFRKLAQTVLTRLPTTERAQLDAYTAGVNAGLAALAEKPFEYLVLRTSPRPWSAEDSVLVIYSMTMDLQDPVDRHEQTLMVLRDTFGEEAVAFFAPAMTPADAALDGSTAPRAPVPGPNVIDLRKRPKPAVTLAPAAPADDGAGFPFPRRDPEAALGSNAFALAGAHTASGAALLASDPHLNHAVPNIWYRASLEWPGHQLTGVTLPGTFALVIGSNRHIAWGLTVAYADTGDLIVLQTNPISPRLYTAPGHDELVAVEQRHETILVKGAEPVTATYDWTIWGPVVTTNEKKRPVVYRWTAHDPAATNFAYTSLEDATTVADAVAIAHRSGIPAHNFLVADTAGNIAWTIVGALPKRVGYDGRLPTSWAFGDRRWEGLLPPDEYPVVTTKGAGLPAESPAAGGRLWSANQRQIGGTGFAKIGDGGYYRPSRAAQIRDRLAPLEGAAPKDLLAIQLDDRALFLAPYQKLLLDTLTPAVVAEKKSRAELRVLVEKWEGRATVDSVSYRLVREFREAVRARVFLPIFEPCLDTGPAFVWRNLPLEDALWTMLREKPAHLLNPAFPNWDAVLVAAADDVVTAIEKQGETLAGATWGKRNTSRIRHPFSYAMPAFLTNWLNYPAHPLPGDNDLPRVQSPTHGASMRLVVSPGRENEAFFHMPGGQSGHPLSPYFRAGHESWENGDPTPLLPGRTEHTLELKP
ncbi:MAG: penicillin acylase family protein [Verrucomicrobia bacterium]|nr:penicillin acylase family protein [Verrucomicrobiota bacterium]